MEDSIVWKPLPTSFIHKHFYYIHSGACFKAFSIHKKPVWPIYPSCPASVVFPHLDILIWTSGNPVRGSGWRARRWLESRPCCLFVVWDLGKVWFLSRIPFRRTSLWFLGLTWTSELCAASGSFPALLEERISPKPFLSPYQFLCGQSNLQTISTGWHRHKHRALC